MQHLLSPHKQTAQNIAGAFPRQTGVIGSSPEIHEKISGGKGCICFFSHIPGRYSYRTQPLLQDAQIIGADDSIPNDDGSYTLRVDMPANSARTIFVI